MDHIWQNHKSAADVAALRRRKLHYKFASASCREASGTSRPGSGLLPPPPPPALWDPVPDGLEQLQTDTVEGPACRRLLQRECTILPTPAPHPHPPRLHILHALGQPGCRGGARKRLQLINGKMQLTTNSSVLRLIRIPRRGLCLNKPVVAGPLKR